MVTAKKKKAPTAAAAASAASPTGIQLLNTPNWSIGNELGAGCQGAVYEIIVGKNDDEQNPKKSDGLKKISDCWVVKVVPVPIITKKKTSIPEMNAGSLSKESLLYQSLLGPTLRGVYLAKIPPNPIPAYQPNVHRSGTVHFFFFFASFFIYKYFMYTFVDVCCCY
jgi:hypothetical protein